MIDRALEFKREDRYESAAAMLVDVNRAVAELAARGPTQLAGSEPPRVCSRAPRCSVWPSDEQKTVKLSRPTSTDGSGLEASRPPVEESIRLPKQRSILPWLALLAFGVIGAKLLVRPSRAAPSR